MQSTTQHPLPLPHFGPDRQGQRGVSLLELMVGIGIGLLTVAVGMGAIMVSRSITGTVGDAARLQQQASYVFRVIGQQLRQTGGLSIPPLTNPSEPMPESFSVNFAQAPSASAPIAGKDSPASSEYLLEISYPNGSDLIYNLPASSTVLGSMVADCLGNRPASATAPQLSSQFRIASGELQCAGSGAAPQGIADGVRDFRVRYLQQAFDATQQPQFRYASATSLTTTQDWRQIRAIEVCVELEGNEVIDTVGSSYTRCDGSTATRGNRLRMVFRNTFHVRNIM